MPWVRRTRQAVFLEPADGPSQTLPALSFLTGRRTELSPAELGALLDLSTHDWAWRTDDLTDSLAQRGLVVSDEPAEPFLALRAREAELSALGWSREAARFHFTTRWRDTRAAVRGRNGRRPRRAARVGTPAEPFHERGGEVVPLPEATRASDLYRVLAARRTTRSFDRERSLSAEQLSLLLRQVWGAHGRAPLALGDTALRKTSPSGGGLHPVEVYPIMLRVEGVEPGVYHYRVRDHRLERLAAFDPAAGASLVEQATAGQWYFAEAAAVFVMTARFRRSFWKYRRHAKAFRTLLLDAGHLSQTFYLVATELGLGPFVTAALNDVVLEEALALDPLLEAPLALCGCGVAAGTPGGLDARFEPLDPAR